MDAILVSCDVIFLELHIGGELWNVPSAALGNFKRYSHHGYSDFRPTPHLETARGSSVGTFTNHEQTIRSEASRACAKAETVRKSFALLHHNSSNPTPNQENVQVGEMNLKLNAKNTLGTIARRRIGRNPNANAPASNSEGDERSVEAIRGNEDPLRATPLSLSLSLSLGALTASPPSSFLAEE